MFGVTKRSAAAALVIAAVIGGGAAEAATVTGIVTADNDFIVVTSPNNAIARRSVDGNQWRKPQRFSFEVDENDPKCAVNVIAWGDGSSVQGLAAAFQGNAGTVFTGGGGISALQTTIPAPPNQWASTVSASTIAQVIGQMDALTAPPPNPQSFPGTVLAPGTNPWGSQSPNSWAPLIHSSNQNSFRWVWPSTAPNNVRKPVFSVFRIACNRLVKQVTARPNPMPGEHYQCYDVQRGERLRREQITVEDQFGSAQVVLGRPVMHCNPSAKKHRGGYFDIQRKERHLVCYEVETKAGVRRFDLEVGNQFTTQRIVTGQRRMFCVPSHKRHR